MTVHLVEPDAEGRISGGYLYNYMLSEGASGIKRHAVRLEALEQDMERLELRDPGLVLADSLFLAPQLMQPFLALRSAGLKLGVVLHAFPSFIERAQDRARLARELPLKPTPSELALLSELELLVAPGPYVPRLLAECGLALRTLVCPPGVEACAPSPRRQEHSELQVISIGAVTELKGLTDGLRALACLPQRSWRWTIVGHLGVAPAYVASLVGEVCALGLEKNVQFTGQCARERTLALLEQSDALLLPSYTENCPLVALEALSLGVPIVGYRVGGLPDIVLHEQTGLLAPLLDVDALTGHLTRLAEDAGERQRLARAARAAGSAQMSWPQASAHFQDCMQRELLRISAGTGAS